MKQSFPRLQPYFYESDAVDRIMVDRPPIVPDPKPPLLKRKSLYLTLALITILFVVNLELALGIGFVVLMFWVFVMGGFHDNTL
jgi:hypothetical protein